MWATSPRQALVQVEHHDPVGTRAETLDASLRRREVDERRGFDARAALARWRPSVSIRYPVGPVARQRRELVEKAADRVLFVAANRDDADRRWRRVPRRRELANQSAPR
jgi:hypothetical protein